MGVIQKRSAYSQRGLIPARMQFLEVLSHCDRVAFLLPGVPATLSQTMPEIPRM